MKTLLITLIALILTNPIRAQGPPLVTAEIITPSDTIIPGEQFTLAVRLTIRDEWHIYWENPGDTGLKTSFTWLLPPGFSVTDTLIPFPGKFPGEGMVSYGFGKEVLYLFRIKAPAHADFTKPVIIKVESEWLACKEVCIPGTSAAEATLYPAETPPVITKEKQDYFAGALSLIPQKVSFVKITAQLQEETVRFELVAGPAEHKFTEIEFFPLLQGIFSASEEQKPEKINDKYYLIVPLDPMRIGLPDEITGIFYTPGGWDTGGTYKAIQQQIKLNK
ncbi:MAG: protein-disulfide reductase DsbD domain-containing protein [Ignavibacteriaceae bacterium]